MPEIKGTALIDTIKAIKARSGEEKFAGIVRLLNGEARSMLEGRISPSSWYSLDAFADFLEVVVRETSGGKREALIGNSEKVIEAQLKGIYKVFIRLGSPAFIIKRIAAVHATYFNGIEIVPQLKDSNEAVIKYVGFQSRHEIMGYTIIGFFRKALQMSGAKEVAVNFSVPISAGRGHAELAISWA